MSALALAPLPQLKLHPHPRLPLPPCPLGGRPRLGRDTQQQKQFLEKETERLRSLHQSEVARHRGLADQIMQTESTIKDLLNSEFRLVSDKVRHGPQAATARANR